MTRRLIVEVRGGRANGTKAVIAPGATMRFGRTEIADVVVPYDELLSGVHFELSWDGQRCSLRDRKSHLGTTLDGAPVAKAEVPHGGWIRAGRTDFLVYVEGHGAREPRAEDLEYEESDPAHGDGDGDGETDDLALEAPGEADRRRAAERALSELRAEASREPLYAILDAARDPRILDILRESVEKHQSLYEGTDGEALDDVAPYLAGPMQADSMLLDRLVLSGWGRRYGIYVTSPAPFREIRRHFRRFLMVDLTDSEEKVYFRFYDPGVMARFLACWTPAQRAALLEGVTRIFAEDDSLAQAVSA